jgi:polyphosphate kinase
MAMCTCRGRQPLGRTHLLSKIPYEEVKRDKIKLPKREKADGYVEKDFARNWVAEEF